MKTFPGAVLVSETLSREEVYALESACDCFVSLHRSEGFGLVPAECMAFGKPAIATGWSGNLEYMRPENAALVDFELVGLDYDLGPYRRDEEWAEPNLDHAAQLMRELVTDSARREQLGSAARESIQRTLSPEAVGRRLRDRLEWIARRRG